MNNHNWKRTFAIIWGGQLFSSLTSAVVGFAVSFWMSIETGSPQVLAYAMMATLLPSILLGPFTGVYIDRWDRKKTMILSDSFVAICSAAIGLLYLFDLTELWALYLLLGLRSIGDAFYAPSMQASVPLLAPKDQLMRIAGISQMIRSASNIAGPALGAVCVAFFHNMFTVMMLDVIGAAIACTTLLFVTIPNPVKDDEEESVEGIWAEMKEGFQHMIADRGIAYMIILITIAIFFIVPISAMYPLMTTGYFGGNEFEMGVVEVCWGVGMLLGGILISTSYMKTANRVISMNLMAILLGLCFWGTGLISPSAFPTYVFLTAMTGVGSAIYWSSFTVILQTTIHPSVLGRVFSTYDSISLLPCIPGLLATGFVAEAIGLSTFFVVAGVVLTLIGIVAFFIPAIRRLGINSKMVIEKDKTILDQPIE